MEKYRLIRSEDVPLDFTGHIIAESDNDDLYYNIRVFETEGKNYVCDVGYYPEHYNRELSGNRYFADVYSDLVDVICDLSFSGGCIFDSITIKPDYPEPIVKGAYVQPYLIEEYQKMEKAYNLSEICYKIQFRDICKQLESRDDIGTNADEFMEVKETMRKESEGIDKDN